MKRIPLRYEQPSALANDLANPLAIRVPTDQPLDLGTDVLLDIHAPELKSPASVVARVVSFLPGGYQVSLDGAALAPMRLLLGRNDAAKPFGRRAPRVDCELPAKVLSPVVINGCSVTNLSATGMMLVCPQHFEVASKLSVVVMLSGFIDLPLSATVMSAHPDTQQLALDFYDLDSDTHQRLEQMTAALLQSDAPENTNSPQKRVLVADDDASITTMLARVILDAGHTPITVSRGDDALAAIREEKPHLAFLDALMPGLDGVAVAQQVRADPELKGMPLILMSALDAAKLAQSLTLSKADEAISKPLKLSLIRGILAKYLLYTPAETPHR
jgi:CheY-like chemotaxis protein